MTTRDMRASRASRAGKFCGEDSHRFSVFGDVFPW